jgi:hypothetical protein
MTFRDQVLMKGQKPVKEGFLFYGVETGIRDRTLFEYSVTSGACRDICKI